MSASKKNILLGAMTVIVLLSACQPAPPPTQDASDVENQVATIVALTVAAQNAQTQAAVSPTPEVTNTTLPTQTEVGVPSPTPLATSTTLPTATVIVLPTSSTGGGGGGTTTKREYSCDTIRRRPLDNTSYRPGDKFDIKWTIVNTGTKTMVAGLDLKFNSGTQMTNRTRVELPELKPGAQFAVDFDAVAPNKEGTYVMTFLVEGGLCYPYVAIIVEK
ncbi:MAG TPA: NBR1-Ig-like domain-containing protein [Anaerolineales bacterium]|nr:NBR1-Ig-like domain-containing protein [Anaerolineales bacterium]